jgi:branched-chain amino acid transport system ATP-binding protein
MPSDTFSGGAGLDVAGLRTGYGDSPILQGIDLTVRPREIVAVIGRNGVGKSTMMRCLIGQLRVWAGAISFNGNNISALPAEQRAKLGFGYIPQGREVFSRMTVEENLRVGEMIGSRREKKLYEMVYEFFPILAERREQKAGTMSGGQQQQLAIGRAMIGNPKLLLLDEPSEGIQPSIVFEIMRVIRRVNNELGTTILFVEQNLDVIQSLAQRCYVMDKGRIVAERQAHELQDREVAKRDLQI